MSKHIWDGVDWYSFSIAHGDHDNNEVSAGENISLLFIDLFNVNKIQVIARLIAN